MVFWKRTAFGLSVAAMPAALERMYVHTIPDRSMKKVHAMRSALFSGSISPYPMDVTVMADQ